MTRTWEIEGQRPAWLKPYLLFSALACLTWAYDLFDYVRWNVFGGTLNLRAFDPSMLRGVPIIIGIVAVYAAASIRAFKRPSAIALWIIVPLAMWLASRLPEELSLLYHPPEYIDAPRLLRGFVMSIFQIASTVLLVRGYWINARRGKTGNRDAVD